MHRKQEIWFLEHGTNCPFLYIIIHIIIIHIANHIFLFQPASVNLRAFFLLKPMAVWVRTFYITGQLLHVLKVLFYNLFSSYSRLVLSFQPTLTIEKPQKYTPNSPLRSVYCIINYPIFLNISAGIPIAC